MDTVSGDRDSLRWADEIRRDLRHALRAFAKKPGFAAVVILTLGLGIGATTAVFSVVNAVVLRPLKAPPAEWRVRSLTISNGRGTEMPSASTLRVWTDRRDVFEDVSAHRLHFLPCPGTAQRTQNTAER